MSWHRTYRPKKNPQLMVYVRWHDRDNGPIASFYGPFASADDAAGFREEFSREHLGTVDATWIERLIPVEPLEFFDSMA